MGATHTRRATRRFDPRRRGHHSAALTCAAVLALCAACASNTSAAAPTGPPGIGAASASRLDTAIPAAMSKAGIPGAIVGVWTPTGSYVKAFGIADKTTHAPVRTDVFMRIGSETKTFTVTALLQLVDQGKVKLDDPIARYVAGVPSGNIITLRELARMQSGLVSYTADPGFDQAFIGNPQRSFTPQQLLAASFSHPLAFAPGTNWQYSNTNTVLIGLTVEKVTRQPLGQYLQHHIFGPLHMTATSFPDTNALPNPHAEGYTLQTPNGTEADAATWNPSWAWAAGAVISNLDDLRTWAASVATGQLLAPATQQQRLQTVPIPGVTGDVGYGLGIFDVHGWIGHNGSLPGYQSLTIYLPSQRETVVVLLNTDTAYEGIETSTVVGQAITSIVTPKNVYSLPAAPQQPSTPTTPG